MKVENVPEDLFKPVYFRAKETQRPNGIIKDALAVEVVKQMLPDCPIVDDWTIQFGIAIHTLIVDNLSNNFYKSILIQRSSRWEVDLQPDHFC